ncbi:MAG: Regulator of nucleoside diphosphate kinase [Smithella sp. PtaU1.Bin162]|nr:MAG: Regulator of nucleoside diphosphate kinase [Smithella sp. PtaU1.Bin162]
MKEKSIYITDCDFDRLAELLESVKRGYRHSHFTKLENELERAIIVAPKDMPSDVVTMNSTFSMTGMASDKEEIYTLVYPEGSNFERGRISILAPIATAIIGYRAGDTIEWDVPSGKKTLKVIKILYQPESTGNYDL